VQSREISESKQNRSDQESCVPPSTPDKLPAQNEDGEVKWLAPSTTPRLMPERKIVDGFMKHGAVEEGGGSWQYGTRLELEDNRENQVKAGIGDTPTSRTCRSQGCFPARPDERRIAVEDLCDLYKRNNCPESYHAHKMVGCRVIRDALPVN